MTVQQIAEFACETTGDISSEALDFAKRAIRLKYQTLYDSHNWRESMRTLDSIPVDPTLGGIFFLPYDAEEVIFVSMSYDNISYIKLNYRERDWIERFTYPAFNLPGNTPWFYRAENLAWPYPAPGRFTFTVTDKNPFTLYIAGRDANNFPISDTFILQGIINADGSVSPVTVTTTNTYQWVTVLSKDANQNPVTISASAPAAPLVMPPGMTELVFTQLKLEPHPIGTNPDGSPLSVWLRTQVKLKPDSLDNDYSVPRISHIWDALMCFTTAALWKRMSQLAKSQAEEGTAMEHVKAAINIEKNQSEFFQQAVPITMETGDYLRGWYQNRPTSWNPFGM